MGIITEAAFTKTCHLPFESKTENENSRVHNGEVSMIRYRMFISWLLTSSTTLAPVIVNVSLNSNTGVIRRQLWLSLGGPSGCRIHTA
ncbi:hypothetical protein L208DRAFT_695338 [Tricholoma matsutake]|nr:hypothetical protein L208DRAFT_695338 [Tricholoma matsutake 945]